MKHIVLVVALVAGCNSRGKECQKALDTYVEQAPQNIEKAIGAMEHTQAEALRKRGNDEVSAMKAKFVDACKKADKFDVACYTDPAKSKTEDCQKMTRALDEQVLGPLPSD